MKAGRTATFSNVQLKQNTLKIEPLSILSEVTVVVADLFLENNRKERDKKQSKFSPGEEVYKGIICGRPSQLGLCHHLR